MTLKQLAEAPKSATTGSQTETWIAETRRLASSGSGIEKLQAFSRLQDCANRTSFKELANQMARDQESESSRTAMLKRSQDLELQCIDVSPLDLQLRQGLISDAIRNKTPGYSLSHFASGPNGVPEDQYRRKDDPLVVQWYQNSLTYLADEARRGNSEAAATGIGAAQFGPWRDDAIAFAFAKRRYEILAAENGQSGSAAPDLERKLVSAKRTLTLIQARLKPVDLTRAEAHYRSYFSE